MPLARVSKEALASGLRPRREDEPLALSPHGPVPYAACCSLVRQGLLDLVPGLQAPLPQKHVVSVHAQP
jgi:hypothetical protein